MDLAEDNVIQPPSAKGTDQPLAYAFCQGDLAAVTTCASPQ
jgi:hypothetical protein